ncbi:MAG: glycosyltransferase family 9 protein [Flavobacteriales bacterium]|nr:glycosyltransferase family 9 protein [Flavobacteriales bacterium]
MAKQFLVIQTAFLGDAVLATSLLEKLHAHYPDAAIDLVVRKGNDGLFTGHPFLRKLFVWDKRTAKNKALFKLISELRKTEYDHIINCQRFFSTGLMTAMARGKEKIGYDKNPLSFFFSRTVKHVIGDDRHEVDRLNALIEHLTDGTRPLPRLYPTPDDRAKVDTIIRLHGATGIGAHEHMSTWTHGHMPYVCIAPASVWFTKQWPEHKWIELVEALPKDRQVFIIGAPGDSALAQRIITACGRGVDLTKDLRLLESAALMEGAVMNYVNDSAPLHIASAMNAPVTVVFCSTVPAFGFGPLHENGRVVETSEKLDCRPCGLHGHKACPKGHFKCAEGIGVDRIVAQ